MTPVEHDRFDAGGQPPPARDLAARTRDRAAEARDRAAEERDEVADTEETTSFSDRRLAARDRLASARDRRSAAADRAAAREELDAAGTDALTGVMGRGPGLAALAREVDRAGRTGEPLVVAFVDAVGLKETNDTRGHLEGDRILREIADCLTEDLRSYDIVVRVGGDEFVCAHSGEGIEDARRRYAEISRRLEERGGGASMTVGLAARADGESPEALVDRADRAMIAARGHG